MMFNRMKCDFFQLTPHVGTENEENWINSTKIKLSITRNWQTEISLCACESPCLFISVIYWNYSICFSFRKEVAAKEAIIVINLWLGKELNNGNIQEKDIFLFTTVEWLIFAQKTSEIGIVFRSETKYCEVILSLTNSTCAHTHNERRGRIHQKWLKAEFRIPRIANKKFFRPLNQANSCELFRMWTTMASEKVVNISRSCISRSLFPFHTRFLILKLFISMKPSVKRFHCRKKTEKATHIWTQRGRERDNSKCNILFGMNEF